eukprot:gene7226-9857_t
MIQTNNDKDGNWVNFEFGEDVRNEDRLRQDEEWSSAVTDGRGHVSHREQTMLYAPQFCLAISDFEAIETLIDAIQGTGDNNICLKCPKQLKSNPKNYIKNITMEILAHIIQFAYPGQGLLVWASIYRRSLLPLFTKQNALNKHMDFPFRICVRKRPILPFEYNIGAFDVCDTNSEFTLTLHEGKLARNGRQLSMNHTQYIVDEVFGENTDNSEIACEVVEPLLEWAELGNRSTLLCFGQTGTGKTYTLYGALEYISTRLIGKNINVMFYEVHGKKCYDLLSQRKVVHLRSDENDEMHVRGALKVNLPCVSSGELLEILKGAVKLRKSQVTERNPISSRSHAVCSIEINIRDKILDNPLVAVLGNGVNVKNDSEIWGQITLVDLAGSERNYETTRMTASEHKESAEINFALMSLKNCFRALHAQLACQVQDPRTDQSLLAYVNSKQNLFHQDRFGMKSLLASYDPAKAIRIPYRASLLTKVLKSCFTCGPMHRTTIIATVSPTAIDLQHTLNTLDHIVLMSPILQKLVHTVNVEVPIASGAALSHEPIPSWTPEQVNAWIASAERGRFAHLVLPRGLDGKGLMELSATNFAELFSMEEKQGRQETEGPVWVVAADENNKSNAIGKALWSAIRRENYSAIAKKKAVVPSIV